MLVIHKGKELFTDCGFYGNGRKALTLTDQDSQPVLTVTVNIPEAILGKNEVFIKAYSENEDIDKALIRAGIIHKDILQTIRQGFVKISSYRLTDTAIEMYKHI